METPEAYPELTPQQELEVAKLTKSELELIDEILLSNSSERWRKQAMVIGKTMMGSLEINARIPDIFFAKRIKQLVENGRLEAQGNLNYIRFSEVRIPNTTNGE